MRSFDRPLPGKSHFGYRGNNHIVYVILLRFDTQIDDQPKRNNNDDDDDIDNWCLLDHSIIYT